MIVKVSDYIVSPLALGTRANYVLVKAGQTRLRRYECLWERVEPFVASRMEEETLAEACREEGIEAERYTRFERMALLAAIRALRETDVCPDSDQVLFVLATTKGNIELLDPRSDRSYPRERLSLLESARQVTGWFHNPNTPLVVCNACVSGLDAQLEAVRALESGRYRYAVVIGADVLSPFVVSGFQSLKAMANECCRPFDEDRNGLNLGEAAACVVYGREEKEACPDSWQVAGGAIRNDAFHLSGPSKTAEGAYRALKTVLDRWETSGLAFVNVHGTATLFNDEMEAMALDRMGLDALPAFGLKGYFGHTMGAAGVLETLISMEALDDGIVPATKGFERLGVSRPINVSPVCREARGNAFLKMMSGFGGCNAVMLFRKGGDPQVSRFAGPSIGDVRVAHTVLLTSRQVVVDGEPLVVEGQGMALLKELYRRFVGDYPKYHKMDPLCKLGFLASELLLDAESRAAGTPRFVPREDRAIVLVGRHASICADRAYQETIQRADDYFPSPSAFIYTLPNIVTGEIAIRNQYHGETAYFAQATSGQAEPLLANAFRDPDTRSVIGGWIDMADPDHFEVRFSVIVK